MSDDTPQKGWDSWFSADQDSSGGERQAPDQGVAATPPDSAPESEAEQTDWTMPAIRDEPRERLSQDQGQAQAETQVTKAPEAAQAPDAMPTQVVAASPDGVRTQVVSNPDAMRTQVVSAPDAIPTQVVSTPDAMPTQVVSTPDAAPTQVVSSVPAQAQAPAPASAPPQANTWQPPQPAQVWGNAQQPVQESPQQQAPQQYGYQGTAQLPPQQQPQQQTAPAEDWTGWDDGDRRRPTPAPAFAAYGNGGNGGNGGDEAAPRSRRKVFLASGIGAVAIVGLATVLVLNQGSLTGSAGATPTPSGFQPTGTSVAGDAEQTADAFLAAWESGNFKQAAAYTDDPTAAFNMLTSYGTGLNLHGLQLTATGSTALSAATSGSAANGSDSGSTASASSTASTGASVPSDTAGSVSFSVVAKVGLPATSSSATSSTASSSASASASASTTGSSTSSSSVTADWSYSSKLVAYKKNGGWWVQWAPSLIAPNLTADEKVASVAVSPSASEVVDASGNDLSNATDPGVHNIAAYLKKAAPSGQGTPGVDVVLLNADGTQVSGSTAVLSQPVNTGVVKTTFNPTAETAAQQAVLKYPDSSMVVLQPSTGNILAVANNDGGNDFALTARIAPGSTNKIITTTALLTSGLVSSPSQAVECPKSITVNGTVFANSENESEPANTPFLTDFAVSCNNAFGQWYDKIGSTTLAQTAEKYYGLNQQWNFGTGAAGPYYSIPSSASNGELFQELFGQGQLEAAPLAMASVAATVDTGSFKQPIVVQGAAQLSATSLPTNVQQDLWQMMKAVTTESDGTAYNLFSGVSSTVYGKTGTADVGSTQDKPNSWMVVFDPTLDIAIGCVVLDAGYGASFAGPETAAVLQQLQ